MAVALNATAPSITHREMKMPCKGCGVEGQPLVVSGYDKTTNQRWDKIYLCPKCWAKYRDEKGIFSLLQLDKVVGSKKKEGTAMMESERKLVEAEAFQERLFGIKNIFKCIKCGLVMEDYTEVPDHILKCYHGLGDLMKEKKREGQDVQNTQGKP
jgi:hypothetical protein